MPSIDTVFGNFTAVVVTGGSSGIGKSFIELLGTLCPEISFCNLSRSAPVINNVQLKLRHVPCDLSDASQVRAALVQIQDFLTNQVPSGRVLLINNSGFGSYGRFPEPSTGEQLQMVDVNIRAVVHLTGELLPTLKARGGAVVTVASTAAFQPTPFMAAYGASKAFVLHWSVALHEELRGSGVTALALCPGPTSTQFFLRAGLKEGSVPDFLGQTSEEVVWAALRALAAGKSLVVSGWKNKLIAALSSKMPKPLVARVTAAVLDRYRLQQVKP